jgi:hypothetical protein
MAEDTPADDARPVVALDDEPTSPPEPPDAPLGDGAQAGPAAGTQAVTTPRPLGRVGAPRGAEATSEEFSVWVPDDQIIEKTQLVRVETEAGAVSVRMYGLVSEVSRRSRRVDILEESDRYDNEPAETVPTSPGGVTYARVRVLGSDPTLLTPPREEAPVFAGDPADASAAYGMDAMETPTTLGLVRNGGDATAGPAKIDLDYLLGAMGGHCNVTGIAGVGTKSSLLTILLSQTLAALAQNAAAGTSSTQARAVILNVKGFDLFWLDHWSTAFTEADAAMWREMGQPEPRPMDVDFYAPQAPGSDHNAVPTGRDGVLPYSWSLEDIVTRNLLPYLFGDAERDDDNFALLLGDLERVLMEERTGADGVVARRLHPHAPARTFRELLDWFEAGVNGDDPDGWQAFSRGSHHSGTLRRFHRRLRRIVYESAGIFRLQGADSHPLEVRDIEAERPLVVDIQSLGDHHLQRFVVAALLKQAADEQTGPRALRGMHYLFMLDELNRFAPKGQTDPITRLIETVAAELRSRGVILLGAQQQASLVSPRVVENAAIRVLGRTGGHELRHDVFSFVPSELRDYVEQLGGADKLVYEPSFREPMAVVVPRPPWAMRSREASTEPPAFLALEGAESVGRGPRTLPHRPYEEIP